MILEADIHDIGTGFRAEILEVPKSTANQPQFEAMLELLIDLPRKSY